MREGEAEGEGKVIESEGKAETTTTWYVRQGARILISS